MSEPSAFEAVSCTGKVSFPSHAAASRIQKRRGAQRDHGKRGQQVYRCKVCHGWHIGGPVAPERPNREWQRWRARYEGASQ